MKKQVFAIGAMCLSVAVFAEGADGFNTSWGNGWRLTIGPQLNFGVKGRLGVKGGSIPVPAQSSSSTRAAAKSAGDAISVGSGRTTFPNGAFIDPEDSAGIPGETWNWYIPAGELNGGTAMSIANPYVEQSSAYTSVGGRDVDDSNSVGASFGLDRTVWKWGDFGVDVGFNFSFFMKDNWFKGESGGYTRTDTYTTGSYITDVDLGNVDVLLDPWAHNPDGSYGAGTFDGPGPVLNLGDAGGMSVSHRWGNERTQTSTASYGPFSVRGDLQVYEFQLALKPYYEITEWFMVRGTVGLGIDYRNLDVRVSGVGRGSEHDWDCYMICGLGGMFHWNGICLGAEFLRKVFDDDMDVDTRYVNGSIGNASWMLRAYVGYEF